MYTTIGYKGSKRKLLDTINLLAEEVGAATVLDGFCGSGIVSASLRQNGLTVTANDLGAAAALMTQVFLEGYDSKEFEVYREIMASLPPQEDWLTHNYSGKRERVIRGTGGSVECRPMAFTRSNAMRLDAARNWIERQETISPQLKRALIFSVILAADRTFNGTNDQKSALKNWTDRALAPVVFPTPTLVKGPKGTQLNSNILELTTTEFDFVYFDPPYTHGVLYDACYHLSDSIAVWNKPELNYTYALPRPHSVCYRDNGKLSGGFYNKATAFDCFKHLVDQFECKRMVVSYSDAPRNVLTPDEMFEIFKHRGDVSVHTIDHKICTQPSQFNKISTKLKEVFIVVDTL